MKSSNKKKPNSINISFNDSIENVKFHDSINSKRSINSINKKSNSEPKDIWENSQIDDAIEKQHLLQIHKKHTLKIVIISVILIAIFTIVIVFLLKSGDKIDSMDKVSNIVYIDNKCTVIFDDGTNYSIDIGLKHDGSTGEPYIQSSFNGSTLAIIDSNSSLHIITKYCHQVVNDVECATVSFNGDGVVYVSNAVDVGSVRNKKLRSGELCYFNTLKNENKKIDSDVLNDYLAISSNGKAFSYVTKYTENIDDNNPKNNSLSFECHVCTNYGKSKEDKSFKGFSENAVNPVIVALSDDGNIRYWYDIQKVDTAKCPLYVSYKQSKSKKSDNMIGTIEEDMSKQKMIFSYDSSEILLSKNDETSITDKNGNQTTLFGTMIDSILNNTVNNNTILDTSFLEKYYSTIGNDVVYIDSYGTTNSLSNGGFTDITISDDGSFFVAKKVNTTSLFKVDINNGNQETISKDVLSYVILKDMVYYVDNSNEMFLYSDNISNSIANSVNQNIFVCNDLLYYISNNHLYYRSADGTTEIDNNQNVVEAYPYSDSVIFKNSFQECFMVSKDFNIFKVV